SQRGRAAAWRQVVECAEVGEREQAAARTQRVDRAARLAVGGRKPRSGLERGADPDGELEASAGELLLRAGDRCVQRARILPGPERAHDHDLVLAYDSERTDWAAQGPGERGGGRAQREPVVALARRNRREH